MSLVYAVSTDHRLSLALALTTWLDLSTSVSLQGLCLLLRTMIIKFHNPTFKGKQRGGLAFRFSAAQIWNSLPLGNGSDGKRKKENSIASHYRKEETDRQTFAKEREFLAFKTGLKTYLFKQYFDQ